MSWTSARGSTERTLRAGDPIFVAAMVAIAAWAAWPIYQGTQFLILVGVSVVAGFGLAILGAYRKWSLLTRALIGIGVFLAIGIPIAVPSALGNGPQLIQGAQELLSGVVDGWRQLETISIPVGSYQATLVPALIVFLFGSIFALSLAMRRTSSSLLALPIVFIMLVFGLAFGSSDSSNPIVFGSYSIVLPRELLMGAVAFLTTVSWLGWRSWRARADALRRAESGSGVRNISSARSTIVRRFVLGVMMILVAIVVAGFAAPNLASGKTREVLRVAPVPTVSNYVTPLSLYREFYNDEYSTPLFTVDTVSSAAPTIQLATLDSYDGRVFSSSNSFARVPYTLPTAPGSGTASATVSIKGYRYQWVPVVGALSSLSFSGAHADALTDGFFYNSTNETAVDTSAAGLQSGDRYVVKSAAPASTVPLASLTPPAKGSAPLFRDSVIPASLTTWVKNQNQPYNGAGLQVLITRLRNRGYLSHSLITPSTKGVNWMTELAPPYTFQSSAAGQSDGRIDQLFTSLNQKQDQVGGTANAPLVAAVGDDEQFAAAGALVAEKLGFPARVVVGANLADCVGGVCKGNSIAAWIEVQGSNGQWVEIDVTPQHVNPVEPNVVKHRDPNNATEVAPKNATVVSPDQDQVGNRGAKNQTSNTGPDLTVLWATLRGTGVGLIVLLILAGPFLIIAGVKVARRRGRRRLENPESRIAAGWEEYVDVAIDYGLPVLPNPTRTEIAARYGGTTGPRLAALADRAVFGWQEVGEVEGEEFWREVDEERKRLQDSVTRWGRIKAAISLRSLTQSIPVLSRVPAWRAK
jgi:Transglutaminase-like superfamily